MSSRSHRFVSCVLALAGCDECPPDPHVIRAMRVLGAVSEPAVATPGGVVTLRALTVDVEERDLEVAWYRCPVTLLSTPRSTGPSSTAGLLADPVERCLASGVFARGVGVRVPIDPEGGSHEMSMLRPWRRWTDLVGFACAGGRIEAPPASGVWPRCTGARGVVFTASIPGPRQDGTNPPSEPVEIVDLSFGPEGGARAAWSASSPPEVARCDVAEGACARWEFRFAVSGVDVALEATGATLGGIVTDRVAYVSYHFSDALPPRGDSCGTDFNATLRPAGSNVVRALWTPPPGAGDVTFWITARRATGALTVQRRTVRVR